eukprot:scaffold1942_cov121-Skeletonema_menzelii.AAC.3
MKYALIDPSRAFSYIHNPRNCYNASEQRTKKTPHACPLPTLHRSHVSGPACQAPQAPPSFPNPIASSQQQQEAASAHRVSNV